MGQPNPLCVGARWSFFISLICLLWAAYLFIFYADARTASIFFLMGCGFAWVGIVYKRSGL